MKRFRNYFILGYLEKRKIGFVFRNFDVNRKIFRRDEKKQKSMKRNESLLFKNFNIDRKIFKGNK